LKKEKDGFVEQSHDRYRQIAKDFIAVCPKCESTKIYIRRRKMPKYICKECGIEFDDPKAKIVDKTQKQKDDYGKQYTNPDR